jgi:23S rRNA (cytidine1920-2'-O)/16S rRNA (cytidine1409-2'-O)-methyltransferase
MQYISRAGNKLDHALKEFKIDVSGKICADLGCSTGGFTDCLLSHGAQLVYAVDTAYGVLDYKLRINPKVVVLERQNALHVSLPQQVDFISIDVGWTPQRLILPHALTLLKSTGSIVSLLKPHYESGKSHLEFNEAQIIADKVVTELIQHNINVVNQTISPITGEKAKNPEFLLHILPNHDS